MVDPRKGIAQIARAIGMRRRQIKAVDLVTLIHPGGSDTPFPFHAALAVLSARAHHPDVELSLIAEARPFGPNWDAVASLLTFATRSSTPSASLALHVVQERGGLVIQTDVLVLQNMDYLANYPFVIGVEPHAPGQSIRFGRSIMMGQRSNRFVSRWLAELHGESRADMEDLLPLQLYASHPDDALLLPHFSWHAPHQLRSGEFLFNPAWGEANEVLVSERLALHLHGAMNADRLAEFTPVRMQSEDHLLARLGRSICAKLPAPAAAIFAEQLLRPADSSHG